MAREFLLNCSTFQFINASCLFFAAIYFGFGGVNWTLTRYLLPKLGIGHPLDAAVPKPGQIRREMLLSTLSVLIFGVGAVLPWGLLRLGWSALPPNPSTFRILVEIFVLFIWNEIHFYTNHWLLHRPSLRKYHLYHHRSIVTTPWTTYSFHPLEAAMLGSVLIPPMLLHNFSLPALLAVPLFSLFYNSIGHSNYDFLPWADIERWWLNGSRRHHWHHIYFKGNFGFILPFLDRLFGTALPDDGKLERWQP